MAVVGERVMSGSVKARSGNDFPTKCHAQLDEPESGGLRSYYSGKAIAQALTDPAHQRLLSHVTPHPRNQSTPEFRSLTSGAAGSDHPA